MNSITKQSIIRFILGLYAIKVLVILTLNALPGVELFEMGVYVSYAKSLILDYDLNIINNLYLQKYLWLTTPSFNFPDIHQWGTSILWLPFHLPIKFLNFIGFTLPLVRPDQTKIDIYMFATGLLSITLFVGGLFFIYQSLEKISLTLKEKIYIFLFMICTPLSYYAFFDYSASDTTVFFFSTLMTFFFIHEEKITFSSSFWLGVLVGFARMTKVTFIFFIPSWLLYLWFYSPKETKNKNLRLSLLGFLLIEVIRLLNEWIKFGKLTLFSGLQNDISTSHILQSNSFFLSIFGPTGLFTISPLLFIGSILLFYLLLTKKMDSSAKEMNRIFHISLLFFLAFFLKIAAELFSIFVQNSEFGGRHFLLDLFPFALLVVIAYRHLPQKWPLKLLLTIAIFYQFCITFSYLSVAYSQNVREGIELFSTLKEFSEQLIQFSDKIVLAMLPTTNDLKYFFAILVLLSPTLLLLWVFKRYVEKSNRLHTTGGLLLGTLLLVTFSNLYFNPRNALQHRESPDYKNLVIGLGDHIIFYDDFVSEMFREIEITKILKRRDQHQIRINSLESFLKKIPNEIVHDPTNFSEQLKNGVLLNHYDGCKAFLYNLKNFDLPTEFTPSYPNSLCNQAPTNLKKQ